MEADGARTQDVTWSTPSDALRLLLQRRVLRRCVLTAIVVGTVLSLVNQLHVIAAGEGDTATWLRVGANYVIPFIVSNVGALSATRLDPS